MAEDNCIFCKIARGVIPSTCSLTLTTWIRGFPCDPGSGSGIKRTFTDPA